MEDTLKNEDVNVLKVYDHLKSVIIIGETIEDWTIQRRLFALTHRRVFVAATSGRLIVIKRGLFGGFEINDMQWQDIEYANLKTGIFGASLLMGYFSVTGLRKKQTESIYRIAQAQEQAWREKMRIRNLEEMRAESGVLSIDNHNLGDRSVANKDDSLDRLKKAKEMLENKLISDSEYESIKAKIINGL